MIAYDFHCSNAHRFEGWFASSEDCEKQRITGLIQCPLCGDADVLKAPSAPYVGRKTNQMRGDTPVMDADPVMKEEGGNDSSVMPFAPGSVTNSVQMPEILSAMVDKLAEVQKEALKDSTWVGREFAEEARAIHYGETGQRKIHGEVDLDEAESLIEEGVSVAPLPLPYIPPLSKN